MAKVKPVYIKVDFNFGTHVVSIPNVLFRPIPKQDGQKQFMHLEQKGNTWLLLCTEEFANSNDLPFGGIDIVRGPRRIPNFLLSDGRPLPVTKYTVLTLFNAAHFYHIDEIPGNVYRLCHDVKLFPAPDTHDQLQQITFTVMDN